MIRQLVAHGADIHAKGKDGHTVLHGACEAGLLWLVERILREGGATSVDATTQRGKTPLHHAAGQGYDAIVERLLEAGAPVDAPTRARETPLYLAASRGKSEVVGRLLRHGAAVDTVTKRGQTALFAACQRGCSESARQLVAAGADIWHTSQKPALRIFDAACAGNLDWLVADLLQAGVSANGAGADGSHPLHHAARGDGGSVVALLLKHGAAVDARDADGRTPVHCLAAHGEDVTLARLLVDAGGTVATEDTSGNRPLHAACKKRKPSQDIIALLLETGADPTARNAQAQTALHLLLHNNKASAAMVTLLLDRGADLDARDGSGNHPLHVATKNVSAHLDAEKLATARAVIELLIERGADVDARNDMGQAPHDLTSVLSDVFDKHSSCWFPDISSVRSYGDAITQANIDRWTEQVEAMLGRMADINLQNPQGDTVLKQIAGSGWLRPSLIETCVQRGADVDRANQAGLTPLWAAAHASEATVYPHAFEAYVRLLLEHGADPSVTNQDNRSILSWLRNPTIARLLLEAGAAPSHPQQGKYTEGDTPLHCAATAGATQVAEVLIAFGADIEARNAAGKSPLFDAVERSHKAGVSKLALVELLLHKGASPNSREERGKSVLDTAVREQTDSPEGNDIIRALLVAGAEIAPSDRAAMLHVASRGHLPGLVSTLIGRGIGVDSPSASGRSPLQTAIMASRVGSAQVLIEAGADVSHADREQRTPLHWAALYRLSELVEPLLAGGAARDARDTNGETPLHLAVKQDWPELVEALLDAGADPNTQDAVGATALHKASFNGRKELLRLLLDRGADPTILDDGRRNAADVAKNKRVLTFLSRQADLQPSPRARPKAVGFNKPVLDQRYEVFLGDSPLHRSLDRASETDCVYGIKLTNKRLREIPEAMLAFVNLNALILDRNKVRELPAAFTHFPNLSLLDLSDNQLQTLPDELSQLRSLRELYLNNNPIPLEERARIRRLLPHCSIVF